MKKKIMLLLLSVTMACSSLAMEHKGTNKIAKLEKEVTNRINKARKWQKRGKDKKAIQVLESIIEIDTYKGIKGYWKAKYNLTSLLQQRRSTRSDQLRAKNILHELVEQNGNIYCKILAMDNLSLQYSGAQNISYVRYYSEQKIKTFNAYQETITKLDTAKKEMLNKIEINTYFNLGKIHFQLKKFPQQALKCFKTVVYLTEKYNLKEEIKMEALLKISNIYSLFTEKTDPHEFLLNQQKILQNTNCLLAKARCNCNIGLIHLELQDKKNAETHFNICIEYIEEVIEQKNKYSRDEIEYIKSLQTIALLQLSEMYDKQKKDKQYAFYLENIKHINSPNTKALYKKVALSPKLIPDKEKRKDLKYFKRQEKKMKKIKKRFTCNVCGKEGDNLKKCGACKKVYYCSTDCQKHDWKHGHKAICKKIKRLKKKN